MEKPRGWNLGVFPRSMLVSADHFGSLVSASPIDQHAPQTNPSSKGWPREHCAHKDFQGLKDENDGNLSGQSSQDERPAIVSLLVLLFCNHFSRQRKEF